VTNFLVSFFVALAISLSLITIGIERMVDLEKNIKAIARIYKEGGCELIGPVLELDKHFVLKCADGTLNVIKYD
jgi:hypothetical protein